jgi:hypothetical protein
MTGRQTEFPLAVTVCAWCKPKDADARPDGVSHGMCPRHLKKFKQRLQNKRRPGHSRRAGAFAPADSLLLAL